MTLLILTWDQNKGAAWLPCRLHVLELSLGAAFLVKFPKTTWPDVNMFVKFKNDWPNLDEKKYKNGVTETKVHPLLLESVKKLID